MAYKSYNDYPPLTCNFYKFIDNSDTTDFCECIFLSPQLLCECLLLFVIKNVQMFYNSYNQYIFDPLFNCSLVSETAGSHYARTSVNTHYYDESATSVFYNAL